MKNLRSLIMAGAVSCILAPASVVAGEFDEQEASPYAVMAAAFGAVQEGVEPLDARTMDRMRGGAGIIFRGSFLGEVTGPVVGDIPDGFTLETAGTDRVLISTAFGSFNGFSGILQTTNVIGNMNTVNNVLNLDITIQNVGSTLRIF